MSLRERAFPREYHLDGEPVSEPGMTLRDWFAGQALSSPEILSKPTGRELDEWFGVKVDITRNEIVARHAYALADAMLAAREPKP